MPPSDTLPPADNLVNPSPCLNLARSSPEWCSLGNQQLSRFLPLLSVKGRRPVRDAILPCFLPPASSLLAVHLHSRPRRGANHRVGPLACPQDVRRVPARVRADRFQRRQSRRDRRSPGAVC